MPPKPQKIAIMSHFLIGSPRIALLKKGAISVFVKNKQKAFEKLVNSKATKRQTSESTPKMHLRRRSFCDSFGMLKMSIYC